MPALDLTRDPHRAWLFPTPEALINGVERCPRLIIGAHMRAWPGGYVAVVHNDAREQFISEAVK